MNIVIITSLLPYPLISGGAQAVYNMVDSLRKRHNITIIFNEKQSNSLQSMRTLQQLWPEVTFKVYRYWRQLCDLRFFMAKIIRAFNLRFRATSERFRVERILSPYGIPDNSDFYAFVNEVIKEANADVVQVEFYPFLHIVKHLDTTAQKVFVHHELRYVRNERFLIEYKLTAQERALFETMKRQEICDLNMYDKIITLTDVDSKELQSQGVKIPIFVSPAAVNAMPQPYSYWDNTLTFLGGYAHVPNQEGLEWFLDKVVPLVEWSRWNGISLNVIGKGWPKDKYNLSVNGLKIKFHGFVPRLEDVVSNSIMIVPILTGSGMRMKILEASAMSVPFITTSVGVEGLAFVDGVSCVKKDSVKDWVNSITCLLQSEAYRKKLAIGAHEVYIENYSAEALTRRREQVYYCNS